MSYECRNGRWQDVLGDVVRCDAMIFDAPYSQRVHEGNVLGKLRDPIKYEHMKPEDVDEHVDHWTSIVAGWYVTITCHVLAPVWAAALRLAGRYVFAPLPYVDFGVSNRMLGDGPASITNWIICARPRTGAFMERWHGRKRSGDVKGCTTPGAYVRKPGDPRPRGQRGGKPIGFMRELVLDYTWPGDLVVDTHAGSGSTLAAAVAEGRRGLGAEVCAESCARAQPFSPSGASRGSSLELFRP